MQLVVAYITLFISSGPCEHTVLFSPADGKMYPVYCVQWSQNEWKTGNPCGTCPAWCKPEIKHNSQIIMFVIALYCVTNEPFCLFCYIFGLDIPAARTSRAKSGTFYSTSSSFSLVCWMCRQRGSWPCGVFGALHFSFSSSWPSSAKIVLSM